MSYNDLMRQHGNATLTVNTINSNGTTWLCSNGSRCNNGTDYRVLVNDICRATKVRLCDLLYEYDVLEIQVDGCTLY